MSSLYSPRGTDHYDPGGDEQGFGSMARCLPRLPKSRELSLNSHFQKERKQFRVLSGTSRSFSAHGFRFCLFYLFHATHPISFCIRFSLRHSVFGCVWKRPSVRLFICLPVCLQLSTSSTITALSDIMILNHSFLAQWRVEMCGCPGANSHETSIFDPHSVPLIDVFQ